MENAFPVHILHADLLKNLNKHVLNKMLTVAVHAMSLLQGLQMLDRGSPQNHTRTVTVILQ